METSYKILEDLGIESNDAKKIIEVLKVDNNISASKMIDLIIVNKKDILKSLDNPFSKNNIDNI